MTDRVTIDLDVRPIGTLRSGQSGLGSRGFATAAAPTVVTHSLPIRGWVGVSADTGRSPAALVTRPLRFGA